jgi:hypothetical protein
LGVVGLAKQIHAPVSTGPVKPAADAAPNRATDGVPAAWSFWPDEFSAKGQCDWDEQAKAVRVRHTRKGVIQQEALVKPDERYYATARTRSQGNGAPTFSFGWKKAEGTWLWDKPHKLVIAPWREVETADGWSVWGTLVAVPEGVGRIAVLLGVEGQSSETDVLWWATCGSYGCRSAPDCRGHAPERDRRFQFSAERLHWG